jgi:hypothetical protein
MISEIQINTIARQMLERHGSVAIAHAAHNVLTCEHNGQEEEASEWRGATGPHKRG